MYSTVWFITRLVPCETAVILTCSVHTVQPCTMSHHYMQLSHIHRMHVCLAGACHLHFWQNDQDLLRATVETQGWNRYQKKIWVSLESWHWRRKFSLCRWLQVLPNGCLDSIWNRSLGHCAGDYRYYPMGALTQFETDHWVTVQVITGTPMDDSTQLETEITGSLCWWLQVL